MIVLNTLFYFNPIVFLFLEAEFILISMIDFRRRIAGVKKAAGQTNVSAGGPIGIDSSSRQPAEPFKPSCL